MIVRKNYVYNINNPHLLILTDVSVGWEQTFYTVSENVESFEAFYSVIFPTSVQFITNLFFMRVATVEGTAGEIHFCMYFDNYHSALELFFILVIYCTMYRRG